ncbi:cytochrome c oxidase subunit NDUFA4-like [Coregonus clupeaformis]|uniref:cytochrome c oxidase subunit NDUFA4 n=1 Tax=Coregonus clupeaformis TaxID=59861 RepID=UPI001BE00329|nr:cytochrome c oxidase subunit NDUFA4 [Coregonus clupeaformis]XP_045066563.1 cytochrome c oxidase subunit NDUFA4-like [Coregonus clupeaformis]
MLSTVSRQLKSHPALVPLFIFIGGGMAMSGAYLLRLAMGPHVSWNRNGNPEPWNKMAPTHQHKFYAVNMDYSKLKKEGPDF